MYMYVLKKTYTITSSEVIAQSDFFGNGKQLNWSEKRPAWS